MLRVKVELLPYGSEDNKKVIHSFEVANDGTGTDERGNYIFRETEYHRWQPSVKDWPRDRPVEELIYNVLKLKYDK
jgi:hypothetical protein